MIRLSSTILILLTFLHVTTMNAQKIIPLVGYHDSALWLTEKEGKFVLSNDREEILVPGNYDLTLPSLLPDFAFINNGKKLGVYDQKGQKEVIFLEGFNEVQLFPGKSGEYYIYFLQKSTYHSIVKQVYRVDRSISSDFNVVETNEVDLAVPIDGFYQNGIEVVDSLHVVHHFSRVLWNKNYGRDDGEEIITYRFQDTLQLSSIFSLAKKEFVVPPAYAEIEIPRPGNLENPINASYIKVTKVVGPNEFSYEGKLENPLDTYRYGLYNAAYNMIMPPQKEELWKALNYGFYITQQAFSGLISLYVYDDLGDLIIEIPEVLGYVNSVIVFSDKVYIGSYSGNEIEMEMQVLNYDVYNYDGQLIKTEKFRFEEFVEGKRIARVSIATQGFELLYGLYDFENASYVIPSDYLDIRKKNFIDETQKCPPNINCDHYYECISIDEDVLYDSNFKRFKF